MKRMRLGRGLEALLTPAGEPIEDITNEKTEKLQYLPIKKVQPGRYQPRRDMDPQALSELSESIREHGVLQPIVVRAVAEGDYEIIAGERRWRASQMAELSEIPALVRAVSDKQAFAIALIENIQRESLNPIEEAVALRRLMDDFALTQQQVADMVGRSRSAVTNILRLTGLAEDVKRMVERSVLEMGHARALLSLPQEQQLSAAQHVEMGQLSVRETEALVRRLLMVETPSDTTKQAVPPETPQVAALRRELIARLNTKVSIKADRKGGGKVEIHYSNDQQLAAIAAIFEPA